MLCIIAYLADNHLFCGCLNLVEIFGLCKIFFCPFKIITVTSCRLVCGKKSYLSFFFSKRGITTPFRWWSVVICTFVFGRWNSLNVVVGIHFDVFRFNYGRVILSSLKRQSLNGGLAKWENKLNGSCFSPSLLQLQTGTPQIFILDIALLPFSTKSVRKTLFAFSDLSIAGVIYISLIQEQMNV